jgi:PTH1 family peptidyl-tRNA hydrolase
VGFEVVDRLTERFGSQFSSSKKFKSLVAECAISGERVLMMKPQTFMNLSGEAVGALLNFYKIPVSDLVVVLDDVNLEVGRIRVRPKGGSGGHNGLTSVINHVGTEDFVRIRMGVGRGKSAGDLVSHVLHRFAPAQREVVTDMIERTADAVCAVLELGVEVAMNRFNSAVADQV